MRVKATASFISTAFISTAIVLILSTGALFAQPPDPSTSLPPSPGEEQPQSSSLAVISSQIAIAAASGSLGGFLGWMLTSIINFFLLRNRLISYLIVVANNNLKGYLDIEKWIEAVKTNTIKEGHTIMLAAIYTKNELSDLSSVTDQCLRLLSHDELIRVTKLTKRMREIEALMAGFCESLTDYKKREVEIDAGDVDYLLKKADRILSYTFVLPEKVEKLKELPINYSQVHGAETLVTKDSAIAKKTNAISASKNPECDRPLP